MARADNGALIARGFETAYPHKSRLLWAAPLCNTWETFVIFGSQYFGLCDVVCHGIGGHAVSVEIMQTADRDTP